MVYVELKANSYDNLQEQITEYFHQYPSAGYGTYVKEVQGKLQEWTAMVTRFSSCD